MREALTDYHFSTQMPINLMIIKSQALLLSAENLEQRILLLTISQLGFKTQNFAKSFIYSSLFAMLVIQFFSLVAFETINPGKMDINGHRNGTFIRLIIAEIRYLK